MRTLCASTLVGEILVVGLTGLVAMQQSDLPNGTIWGVSGAVMVLCVLVCGMLGRPGAVQVGWAVQVALIASGFVVPAMFFLGAIFAALLYAGVGALVGEGSVRGVGLGSLVFTAAIYDLLLAPFTVPLVMALARRADRGTTVEAAETATGGSAAGDSSYRWLAGGTASRAAVKRARSYGRGGIGRQRGNLFGPKSKSAKATRIKGVKRL